MHSDLPLMILRQLDKGACTLSVLLERIEEAGEHADPSTLLKELQTMYGFKTVYCEKVDKVGIVWRRRSEDEQVGGKTPEALPVESATARGTYAPKKSKEERRAIAIKAAATRANGVKKRAAFSAPSDAQIEREAKDEVLGKLRREYRTGAEGAVGPGPCPTGAIDPDAGAIDPAAVADNGEAYSAAAAHLNSTPSVRTLVHPVETGVEKLEQTLKDFGAAPIGSADTEHNLKVRTRQTGIEVEISLPKSFLPPPEESVMEKVQEALVQSIAQNTDDIMTGKKPWPKQPGTQFEIRPARGRVSVQRMQGEVWITEEAVDPDSTEMLIRLDPMDIPNLIKVLEKING